MVVGLAGSALAAEPSGPTIQPSPASLSPSVTQVSSPPYGEHSTVRPPPAPVVPSYPIRFPGFEPGQPYLVTGASGGYWGGTVVMFGSRSSDFQRHFRDWYWGSHVRRAELWRLTREQGYPFFHGSFGNLFWDNQPIQGRMGSNYWNLDLDQMTVLVRNDPGSSSFQIDPNLQVPPPPVGQPAGPTPGSVTPLTPQVIAGLPLPKQVEFFVSQQREVEAVAALTDAIAADAGLYSQALLHTFRGYLRLSMKQHELGAADLLAAATLDATAVFVSPPVWVKALRSDNWQTIADELPSKARRSAGGQASASLRFASALLYGHTGELARADRQLREAEAAGLSAPLAEALRKLIGPAKGPKPSSPPVPIPAATAPAN